MHLGVLCIGSKLYKPDVNNVVYIFLLWIFFSVLHLHHVYFGADVKITGHGRASYFPVSSTLTGRVARSSLVIKVIVCAQSVNFNTRCLVGLLLTTPSS